jgi:hypothetical protein
MKWLWEGSSFIGLAWLLIVLSTVRDIKCVKNVVIYRWFMLLNHILLSSPGPLEDWSKFCGQNTYIIIKGVSVCVSHYWLLHQTDWTVALKVSFTSVCTIDYIVFIEWNLNIGMGTGKLLEITKHIIHRFVFHKLWLWIRELLLCLKRYVSLLNPIKSSNSILLHITLRPMVRTSQVIRHWLALWKKMSDYPRH